MKKMQLNFLCFISAVIILSCSANASVFAMPIQTNFSTLQPMMTSSAEFQTLPIAEQTQIASTWFLETKDYSHYLWLMQYTPSGWYYADKHLDPSWILGFSAKDDLERKKFAAIAIKNEQLRIENELAFQRVFYDLQKKLNPNGLPIQYDALQDHH